jgi:threonine dehydrogenase-like Zn-dependent dehydrogenase
MPMAKDKVSYNCFPYSNPSSGGCHAGPHSRGERDPSTLLHLPDRHHQPRSPAPYKAAETAIADLPCTPPFLAMAAVEEEEVIVVGAGQSGLAAAACLSLRGVRSLVLERDDCVGSLWRKRAYDCVRLHLAKKYCALPHAPHPGAAPTYLPRDDFIRYLDAYAARFGVRTRLRREVRAARYDAAAARWEVEAVDLAAGGAEERYVARFLVVAAGENDEKFVPEVPGMETFPGEVVHAAEYRSPEGMAGKSVLVVGCGNSGMEIAYDLADAGAVTSIVVRGEVSSQSTLFLSALPKHTMALQTIECAELR